MAQCDEQACLHYFTVHCASVQLSCIALCHPLLALLLPVASRRSLLLPLMPTHMSPATPPMCAAHHHHNHHRADAINPIYCNFMTWNTWNTWGSAKLPILIISSVRSSYSDDGLLHIRGSATFSDFEHSSLSIMCHSRSLKQYQCNWCHKMLGISWDYLWDYLGTFLGLSLDYLETILGLSWD